MKIINSIFQDLKSWKQIVLNNWVWHFVIAAPIGVILGWLSMFLNFQNTFFEQFGEVFIPIFVMFFGCFGFEKLQQLGRTIEPEEMFESNKDGWFGTIVGTIFIILTRLIIK